MGGRKGPLGPVLAGRGKILVLGLFWPKNAIFFDFDSLFGARSEPKIFLKSCRTINYLSNAHFGSSVALKLADIAHSLKSFYGSCIGH